jgi:hypothetical protein
LGEGSYTAIITDSLGCTVDTTFLITSIIEFALQNLEVWPNPFSEHLFLTIGNLTPLKLDIFSYNGRLVQSIEKVENELHLPALNPGVYLFQFSAGDYKKNEIMICTD